MRTRVFFSERAGRWMGEVRDGERRERRRFETRVEAAEWVAWKRGLVREAGAGAFAVSAEWVAEVKRLEESLDGVPLAEAVEHYHRTKRKGGKTVEEAVEEFHARKADEGASYAHRSGLKTLLRPLVRAFGRARLDELEAETLREAAFAYSKNPESVRNLVCVWGNFFNWCEREELVARSPIRGKLKPPRVVRGEPDFLPVPVFLDYLRKAVEACPSSVPWITLRAFGGMRSEAARAFRWEWYDGEAIRIPAQADKMRRGALMENLPENLRAWLDSLKARGFKPYESRRRTEAPLLKACGPLPRNALRHSFATYHVAAFRNVEETALLMGHGHSPRTLLRHYRGLTTQEEGRAWFAISPSAFRLPEE